MFKNNIVGIAILLLLFSCNPVGEKIAETPIADGQISSIDDIELKKGEEVVFWSDIEISDKSETEHPTIRYNIECDGKQVKYDSLHILDGMHKIKSTVTTKSYDTSGEDGKDSTAYYKERSFENENTVFIVPQNGKYNFDFKSRNCSGFWGPKVSIILRKRS